MNDKVKEFWDNQAKEFGASDLATAPDHYYRELEIEKIIEHLIENERVLDVGCGNGYSTRLFSGMVDGTYAGLDYSEKMIKEAEDTNIGIDFIVSDVRAIPDNLGKFNTIISERCLINLKDWNEQKAAILEMKRCLRPGGRIILVENFEDGLDALNRLRTGFGLHEIKVRWHNRYLQMAEFEPFIDDHFDVIHRENIGNLYYIISRVVYAALAKSEGKEPQYDHMINAVASELPSFGFGSQFYSPNFLYVLRAK